MKKGKTAKLIAFLLAALVLLALCACKPKNDKEPSSNEARTNISSLLDYAKKLEKSGNSEAAAAVYELIAQGGGAELIQKAHTDNPIVEKIDEIEQMEEIFDNTKGGDEK